MRFSLAIVAGFVAMASAATTSSASVDAAQASQIACLDKCDDGDVDCQSHCITVPSPDKAQANNTINCVGNCDQGDGSKADNEAYSKCVQSCISDNYYVTGSGTPEQTGSSNSKSSQSGSDSDSTATATASASGSDSTGSSTKSGSSSDSTASGTGTATGSSSSSTSSDNAAAGVVLGSTGFIGLLAVVLAL